MLSRAQPCRLPEDALLGSYAGQDGGFTDCYSVCVERDVTLGEFVEAFYTTPLFRVERVILHRVAGFQATDTDAAELGRGNLEHYSAWKVEARTEDQLLMCPADGKTRSWLMARSRRPEGTGTRLLFGSAIVPNAVAAQRSGFRRVMFRVLLCFHDLYSRALLGAARRRILRQR